MLTYVNKEVTELVIRGLRNRTFDDYGIFYKYYYVFQVKYTKSASACSDKTDVALWLNLTGNAKQQE